MDSEVNLLQLTEQLYAVALAPDEWPSALQPMVDLLHADHAILLAHETESKVTLAAASAGMDEKGFARFLTAESVQWIEPLRQMMPNAKAVATSALISDRDLERTELYNELLRPVNGFYAVGARRLSPTLSSSIAICRPQRAGDFGAEDTRVLQRLFPHITTALEVHHRLQITNRRASDLAGVLDQLNTGVILTDGGADPVFVNTRAAEVAAERDGLSLDGGPLTAATPDATRRLRDAVAAMSAATGIGSRTLDLERPSRRLPLALTLLPIWRIGTGMPGGRASRVAIFIKEPRTGTAFDESAVADMFHLTGRESEVAALIGRGLKPARVADTLGISQATVRTHLHRVFEKTGTRHQAELVRLLSTRTDLSA